MQSLVSTRWSSFSTLISYYKMSIIFCENSNDLSRHLENLFIDMDSNPTLENDFCLLHVESISLISTQ